MPSQQGNSESGTARKLAGVGVAAAALSGVGSADSSGPYLFNPRDLGVEDAAGFVSADVATFRDHDDLLQVDRSDLTEAWSGDGSTSVADIASEVGSQVDLPVADAQTVLDASDVTAEDVDRISAVGGAAVGAEDRLGGLVLEGSLDGADVVAALDEVTTMEGAGGDAYDRYAVSDDRLDGDVVVASGDGRVLVGGTGGVDATAQDAVDQLVAAGDGEADRFVPESEYAGEIVDELSGMPGIAGVEWAHAGESGNLVPDSAGPVLEANGFLPGDVDGESATSGVGALGLGVDPAGPRAVGVVAYDDEPAAEPVEDTLSFLEDQYPDAFEKLDVSVSTSGSLLIVEAETAADHLEDVQTGVAESVRSTGTLGEGVTWTVLPTLKAAYRTADDYWTAFVEHYI